MFRTARLALAALALCAVALPAMGQIPANPFLKPAKQPPAPVGGGAGGSTGGSAGGGPRGPVITANLSKVPQQWEIRGVTGIKADTAMSIYNLRRDQLDLSSELTFREESSRDKTGWGANGGDFIFKRDTASTNVRDHRGINEDEFVAIYNTKTKRYMKFFGQWDDKPQYIWMVKKQSVEGSGRDARIRFALFNSTERKWFMVCQGEKLPSADNNLICLYDDTFKRFIG